MCQQLTRTQNLKNLSLYIAAKSVIQYQRPRDTAEFTGFLYHGTSVPAETLQTLKVSGLRTSFCAESGTPLLFID